MGCSDPRQDTGWVDNVAWKSSKAQTCQLAALFQTQWFWSTTRHPVAPFLRYIETRIRCGVVYPPHWGPVLGKSRVTPPKVITIPRMELTAAVASVKMQKFLEEQLGLPVHGAVFWTDSTIVLQYIRNGVWRFQTFEANRLSIIYDATSPSQWHHVDSQTNPSDYASHGFSITETHKLECWLRCPAFLYKEKREWLKKPEQIPDLSEEDRKLKCRKLHVQGDCMQTLLYACRHSSSFKSQSHGCCVSRSACATRMEEQPLIELRMEA